MSDINNGTEIFQAGVPEPDAAGPTGNSAPTAAATAPQHAAASDVPAHVANDSKEHSPATPAGPAPRPEQTISSPANSEVNFAARDATGLSTASGTPGNGSTSPVLAAAATSATAALSTAAPASAPATNAPHTNDNAGTGAAEADAAASARSSAAGQAGRPTQAQGGLGRLPARGSRGSNTSAPAAAAASETSASSAATSTSAPAASQPATAPTAAAAAAPRAQTRMIRLPPGAAAAMSNAAAGAGAGGGPAGREAWTEIWGPKESAQMRRQRQALQDLRIRVFRCFNRLGIPGSNPHIRSVMYRFLLHERGVAPFPQNRPNVEQRAQVAAEALDAENKPLKRINVVVFGMRGSGKTAFVHTMLGLDPPDPFDDETRRIRAMEGAVHGIPVRFFDTPGLEFGFDAQLRNRQRLIAIRNTVSKIKRESVLYIYVDRLDAHRHLLMDLPIFRLAKDCLGRSALYTAIAVLTHGCAQPPETPSGPAPVDAWHETRKRQTGLLFVNALQDRAVGTAVSLVDTHPECERDASGELLLPNRQAWRPHLLMNMVAASALMDAQALPWPKTSQQRSAVDPMAMMLMSSLGGGAVPLPFLLQTNNQPKVPLKLSEEERAILTPGEILRLKGSDHEGAREEQRRRREFIRENAILARHPEPVVPTPAPDPPLPPTFDPTEHGYRYRYLEAMTGWITRPFVDSNGPDRSDGINGAQSERMGVLRPPGVHIGGLAYRLFMQVIKDKDNKTFVGSMEGCSWTRKNLGITTAVDSQSVGNTDMLFTLRAEPRLKWLDLAGSNRMKTSLGALVSRRGSQFNPTQGPLATGVRLEQRMRVTRAVKLIGTHVRVRTKQGQFNGPADLGRAYLVEATYKPKEDIEGLEMSVGWNMMQTKRIGPNSQHYSTPPAHGFNASAQKHVSPETMMTGRVQTSAGGQSSLNVRVTSHDKLQLRLAFVVPLLGWLLDKVLNRGESAFD